MTLALLITAVGGAWAQDYYINVNFNSSYNCMETHFHCTIMSMGPEATVKGTLNLSVDGVSKGSFNVDNEMFDGDIAPVDAGNHTWSAVFSPDGGGSFNGNGNFTIDKLSTSIIYDDPTSINMGEGESTELVVYVAPDGTDGLSYSSSDASVASIAKKEYSNDTYIIQAKATGTATITFSFAENTNYKAAEEDVTITVTVLPAPVKVTTNAAEEGATFTEASFNMPAYDATVNYELVRDMSVQMTAQVGDGTQEQPRYRVKKDGNKFIPADMEMAAVPALFTVNDAIEQKALTQTQDYIVQIYAIDAEGQPTGQPMTFATFTFEPGIYAVKAVAADGSDYDGETALSNTFQLFQGYEVTVPAQEFITYYKDEPLYADQETSADAELYTVSDVSGTTVTLSDAITIVPAYTAMLVYNPTDVTKTFLLIPTEDDADAITPYAGFKGTNEDKAQGATGNGPWRMAANTKYYGCNGNDFVWIKNAGAVAAHRCWIEISTANAPSRLTIVFEKEEATGVNEVSEVNEVSDDSWYDLSGRKLDGEPTTKGVYIKDGKKVIIK